MSEAGNRGFGWATLLFVALIVAGAMGLALYARGRTVAEMKRRAAVAEVRAMDAVVSRAEADRVHGATEKGLEDRVEALRKKVADLEAAGRSREGELLAARADIERLRRGSEEEVRRREAAEREAERLRNAAAAVQPEPEPPPPAIPKAAPEPPPPPRGLGPTAVTDHKQVQKLTDGLNNLLACVEGPEKWRLVSAGAAEDDRLVKVILEARTADGTVTKSFQAGEGRFVLQGAAGTLSIKLKEGSVTYPGHRTIPFPEGAYTVLLVVDPAPFRASGHPLLSIQ